MIDIAVMYLDQIANILNGFLTAPILITGTTTMSVLAVIVFNWLIFFFLIWIKSLSNRRG